jgi:hypothetical protein
MKKPGVIVGAVTVAVCLSLWLVNIFQSTDASAAPGPTDQEEQGIQERHDTELTPTPTIEERSLEAGVIESFNEKGHADKDRGHPDYGSWAHMQALRDRMAALCLIFAPDEEAWIAKQCAWTVKGESYEHVPVAFFTNGHVVDEETMSSIQQVDEDYGQMTRDQATYAYWQLGQSAQRHAQNIKQLPRDGEYPKRDGSERGRYSAFTVLPAGDWNYIVDFKSIDYSELEEALDRVVSLADEREAAVRALVE